MLFSALMLSSVLAIAQDAPESLTKGLVVPSVGTYGRAAIQTDAIVAQIVRGEFRAPKAGDTVPVPGREPRTWKAVESGPDGSFSGPEMRGGYAYVAYESKEKRKVILAATGHNVAYVNGEPRTGDPYGFGYLRVPIELKKGTNDLLFQVGRGRLKVAIEPLAKPQSLLDADWTLPDYVLGERKKLLGAVPVVNATDQAATNLAIRTVIGEDRTALAPLGPIPPMATRKVGFDLPPLEVESPGEVEVRVQLIRMEGSARRVLDEATVKLAAKRPTDVLKRTFVSGIDGSVQYYAVMPAAARSEAGNAMILSVHGASVEAIGQASAYGQKSWADIVCPTNRRPYGFDWEEWGRMDAMEALEAARAVYKPDSSRIYLTGHSMGGHGTWQLGVTYPGRFAAIGPCAGWISFFTYGGGVRIAEPDPIEAMLVRASAPSDTLLRLQNLAPLGVFILHGGADETVPVSEPREMARRLSEFHKDFRFHEEPGQGHWYETSDEPGAECMDFAPMMDFFARRRLPALEDVREVRFTTVNPAISARHHWIEVMRQTKALAPTTVTFLLDPLSRRFTGTTENCDALAFHLDGLAPGSPLKVTIDGDTTENIPWPVGVTAIWFEKKDGKWAIGPRPADTLKGPHRGGPLKEEMRRQAVLVYGTKGNAEENRWALRKARFDAEQFWYRGNGSFDVVPDTAFNARDYADRTVVLYGNSETNGAWTTLLGAGPVQVDRKQVRVGDRSVKGDGLACLFVRPRPDSDTASVVAFAGTGLPGLRSMDRLPIFVSGASYPDLLLFDDTVWTAGTKGILAAGFFGNDWSVANGEIAWRG
ncbi:MAG: prolyl oligopeptidase family serine peptidase [Fimbriimonadaceae bacterium]|nr:prolyl oligopeptidase family serine peptidase [Fimbriimonadaceae bacterium]